MGAAGFEPATSRVSSVNAKERGNRINKGYASLSAPVAVACGLPGITHNYWGFGQKASDSAYGLGGQELEDFHRLVELAALTVDAIAIRLVRVQPAALDRRRRCNHRGIAGPLEAADGVPAPPAYAGKIGS